MAANVADITPGSTIHLKVVHQPTNAAAVKTLRRLLSQDAEVVHHNRRHAKIRKKQETYSPRGNRWRIWESRLAKQHPVDGQLGESGTITANLQVLRDLPSVARFVEVTPA